MDRVTTDALKRSLIEELVLVRLAHIIFLAHFRSILIVTIPLPLAVLMSFLFMHFMGISSNLMSLAGIAIAIGVLVDAGIVVTENAFRYVEVHQIDTKVENAFSRPCCARPSSLAGRSSSRWRSSFSPLYRYLH